MILVSGATGRVGSAVVRTLRRLGLDVRALVRKGSEYYWLNDTGCRYFFGDLRDPTSLHRAARGAQYLVLCSGVRLESRDNNHDSVTVKGHEAMLAAARDVGVQRVVAVSCLGADRAQGVAAFDARRRMEELVAASGLEYAVLRAALHEHPLVDLALEVKDRGQVWLPAAGANRLTPLPTADLARMTAASLDLDAVRGRVVDVGGSETRTAREWLDMACEVVGVPATVRVLPGPVAALAKRLGRPVRRYANRLAETAVWFERDLTVDPAHTAALFKLPATPMRTALEAAAARALALRDPEERDRQIVHRQFYATIYEPGTANLADLPDGPPPRQD